MSPDFFLLEHVGIVNLCFITYSPPYWKWVGIQGSSFKNKEGVVRVNGGFHPLLQFLRKKGRLRLI